MHNIRFYAKICTMFKKIFITISLLLIGVSLWNVKNTHLHKELIKVGTSPDYPPLEFKRNGETVGFDIDLAKKIALFLGKELEIVEMDFNSLIPALQAGKVDFIVSGLTNTPQRAVNVSFTNIYYQTSIAAITKQNKRVDKVNDFTNKKIGAQLGSVMASFAEEQKNFFPNIEIVKLSNNLHLLQELKLGRIDVLLLEEGQVKEVIASNPALVSTIFPKSGDGYAIAVAKNSNLKDEINVILEKLQNENEIEQLKKKWFNSSNRYSHNLIESLKSIPLGVIVTLKYALLSVFFGLIIGSILSLCRLSSIKLLQYFVSLYLSIFRGTPLLLQLFIVYFALPKIIGMDISAFAAGIIAFSMNSGAYVSENIRAGIESVDKGQFEAGKSLGLTNIQLLRYIILPQAITNILPSLVNEAINMVKESSIISVIGEADIMRRANNVSAEHYSYLEPLMVAAGCYYIIVWLLALLAKILEKRLKKR